MKQVTLLFLVILFLGTSFYGSAQDDIHSTSYHLNIVLSDQQKSVDLSSVEATFKKAGIELDIQFQTRKNRNEEARKWEFPPIGTNQFTRQQKEWRDRDFQNGFPIDAQQLYLYCVPADTQQFFAIPNKSVGFIGVKNGLISTESVQKTLLIQFGVIPQHIDSVDLKGQLTPSQLNELQGNLIPFRFSDDYENIQTSNGRVAYYFWKEDPDGTFEVNPENPMEQFSRPFKQNHFYVYLDVSNPFFKPRFHVFGHHICLVHLLAVLLTLIVQFLTFRQINQRMLDTRFFKRLSFRFAKLLIWAIAVSSNIFAFYATEFYYTNYHMRFHEITSFHGKSQSKLQHELDDLNQFQVQEAFFTKSQVFRQINSSWYAQHEDRVLYFDVDSSNHARFLHSRNILELKTIPYRKTTSSHYVVFRFHDVNNQITKEKVYNHMGFELTKKLLLPDPAKRVLVFVNGYRPVSTNQSMADFLSSFQEKGVEFPDSKNQLFSMDRYAYWEPWNRFNVLFQQRIQADEVWYADGHHSVSTSNHGSVIHFAGTASMYPPLCQSKYHQCYQTKLPSNQRVSTMKLLATRPNYDGFNLRFQRGKIAGKNLLQVLNEAPNYSKNDTVYFVSHSMGHAYAMGMSSVLKGKVNLGECYIIAPENPRGKTFASNDWKNVWQYGVFRNGKTKHAPCQQDGVAPQSLVKGLSTTHRIPFPKGQSKHMGFFNSHFIGYYTWIFDIPKGKPGYVPQH
jgi:hypothetical protein